MKEILCHVADVPSHMLFQFMLRVTKHVLLLFAIVSYILLLFLQNAFLFNFIAGRSFAIILAVVVELC